MKILVTGAKGQLGRAIARQCKNEHELILTDSSTMDITNYTQVQEVFSSVKPEAVIHCAAYTNVDQAESDFDGAFKVNVVGTQNLAAGCLKHQARMVCISTDYVFDGNAQKPYREFDQTNPLSVYGKTKWLGEQIVKEITGQHYILRTSWLYGEGNNFVRTILRLSQEKDKLQVVNDQVGSPTSTKDLAETVFRLLATDAYGTYHASCNGHCSWYDFAKRILEIAGVSILVEPVSTEAFPRPAYRPKYSVLENYMLLMTIGDTMRPWEEALEEYILEDFIRGNRKNAL